MTDTNVPLYGTQGGGYATWDTERKLYVWHEVPEDFPEFRVGDPIPEMWDVIPANEAARDDLFGNDDFDDSEPFYPYPLPMDGELASDYPEVDDVTLGDYDDPSWTDDGIPPPLSLADMP